MGGTIQVTVLISVIGVMLSAISVAVGIYFSGKNNKRVDIQEIEARASAMTKIEMKLDEVSKDIKGIVEDNASFKTKLSDLEDAMVDKFHDVEIRLTMVESGVKETAREVEKINDTVRVMQEDSKNFQRIQ